MIVPSLTLKTGYSFGQAVGTIDQVIDQYCQFASPRWLGLCDRFGAWGHLEWVSACEKRGIQPILGVEIAIFESFEAKRKTSKTFVKVIARNRKGVENINRLIAYATENFYYIPRATVDGLTEYCLDGDNVIIVDGFLDLPCIPTVVYQSVSEELPAFVLVDRNFYATKDQYAQYEVTATMPDNRIDPMFVVPLVDEGFRLNDFEITLKSFNFEIAESIEDYDFKKASMVKPETKKTLRQLCEEGAKKLDIDLSKGSVYKERLDYELDIIKKKGFESYFHCVEDFVNEAKKKMMVGPGRGSAAGSLVCFLIGITSVIDPIKFDLLFERFIDLNRTDLPDIDIDFEDSKRSKVYEYLGLTYGFDRVAKLGTISYYKPRSALIDVAKVYKIPSWEIESFKNRLESRNKGDERASQILEDAFKNDEDGRRLIEKYPALALAAKMEGHPRHTSVHAAAVLITDKPICEYVAIDERSGAIQLDKDQAEDFGLLKMDCLGLKTLSILGSFLEQTGISREDLERQSLNNNEAFSVLSNKRFNGIFQFEGKALQNLTSKIRVDSIEDMIALTALARPGPLDSGSAETFIKRRNGNEPVDYIHEKFKPIVDKTFGVLIYQEQVMRAARELAGMSWEDVCKLRKAIGKSLGGDAIRAFRKKFVRGCLTNGIDRHSVKKIWSQIETMGSYAFNRSHAAAYTVISYWCCLLKSIQPLQFAVACLKHEPIAKDNIKKIISILRELVLSGEKFVPYSAEYSTGTWSVQNGTVYGPLTGIKGIGPKMAEQIEERRMEGKELTKRQKTLLSIENAKTPYDCIFEGEEFWGHIFEEPSKYKIISVLSFISHWHQEGPCTSLLKFSSFEVRDHNTPEKIEARGGERYKGQSKYYVIHFEDDTGEGIGIIGSKEFDSIHPVLRNSKEGDWFVAKGELFRPNKDEETLLFKIQRIKRLTDNPEYEIKP